MLIENPETLRTWLTSALEPICDADPAALAKYVMALLKKDRPEADLRDFCVDQLDVFLQKETRSFVDLLFTVVRDRSYITGAKSTAKSPSTAATASTTSTPAANLPPQVAAAKEVESAGPPQKGPVKLRISPLAEKPVRSHRSRSRSPRDKQARRHERPARRSRSGRKRSRSRSAERKKLQTGGGRGHRGSSPLLPEAVESLPADSSSQLFGQNPSGSSPPAIPAASGVDKSPPSGVTTTAEKEAPMKGRKRPRCRDYDEKGYCMRGDLCAFDHGPDPVVVENEILPEMLKIGGPAVHPSLRAPPPNLAVPPPGYTSRHPPPPGVDSYSEPYNPEAPSLNATAGAPIVGPLPPPPAVSFAHPPPPLWSQPPPMLVSGGYGVSSTTGPLAPPGGPLPVPSVPSTVTRISGGRNRELITVTDQLDDGSPDTKRRKFPGFDDGSGGGQFRRQSIFDRIGDRSYPVPPKINKPPMHSSTLEVRKIPVQLNNITKLNEHFSQFGNIKNIQVQYDGDMEAALITYSQRYEAVKAHKSTMPILNNRFIRVFWHNAPEEEGGNRDDPTKIQVKSRLGDQRSVSHFSNLQNNPTGAGVEEAADGRRAVIITNKPPVVGSLSRTIFNPKAEMEGSNGAKAEDGSSETPAGDGDENVTPAAESSVAKPTVPPVKTAANYYNEEAHRQRKEKMKEAWKTKMDLHRRKTELFEKQVEQQKIILKQLEKCKDASQKKELFSFLKTLQVSTSKLKEEIRNLKLPTSSRTKEQVQKEVLDTELEMINQKQAGLDINPLMKKLTDLRSEITKLSSPTAQSTAAVKAVPPAVVSSAPKDALVVESSGVEPTKEAVATVSSTVAAIVATGDKKPRDMNITGFPAMVKSRLLAQLKLAGEIEKIEEKPDPPGVYVLYKERADAETALTSIAKSGEFGPINIKWGLTVESGMKEEDSGLSARAILASLGDDGLSDEEEDEDALKDEDDVLKEEEDDKGWKR